MQLNVSSLKTNVSEVSKFFLSKVFPSNFCFKLKCRSHDRSIYILELNSPCNGKILNKNIFFSFKFYQELFQLVNEVDSVIFP